MVTRLFHRWLGDLRKISGQILDTTSWSSDFSGEITPLDVRYSVFLVILSLIPAAIVAECARLHPADALALFFKAPMHTVITGFLMSSLIFLGAHVNKSSRPYPIAYKLMLRLMSVEPLLAFLVFFKFGDVLNLLVYGFLVVQGITKTYRIPRKNAVLFFGITYLMLALFQMQAYGADDKPVPSCLDSKAAIHKAFTNKKGKFSCRTMKNALIEYDKTKKDFPYTVSSKDEKILFQLSFDVKSTYEKAAESCHDRYGKFPPREIYEVLRSLFMTGPLDSIWQQPLFTEEGKKEFHLVMPEMKNNSFWSSTKQMTSARVANLGIFYYFNGELGFIDVNNPLSDNLATACYK